MKFKNKIAICLTAVMIWISAVSVYSAETWSVFLDENWLYANYSEIHTGSATLYQVDPSAITVAVNAGHGTVGGYNYQTLCHPDGTAKVTGGSTAAGSIYATAISSGTAMLDGTPESSVTLSLAILVRDKLLAEGFNVLMLRDQEDVQLDNIARTVISNNNADCHISLHYDSSEYDKGFFYIGVPDIASYKMMEPVASHWEEHNRLGESLLEGARSVGVPIFGSGNMPIDLTQTSYSTIPSIDVEVGDRGSDYSVGTQSLIADGIVEGLKLFFNNYAGGISHREVLREEWIGLHEEDAQIRSSDGSESIFAQNP